MYFFYQTFDLADVVGKWLEFNRTLTNIELTSSTRHGIKLSLISLSYSRCYFFFWWVLKKIQLSLSPRINVTEPHSDNYVWQKIKKSIILSGSAITFYFTVIFPSVYSELEYLSSSLEDSWESSSIFCANYGQKVSSNRGRLKCLENMELHR